MKDITKQLRSIIGFAATFLLWVAALLYLYQVLFRSPQARGRTLDVFIFLSAVALVISIAIFCWRKYNYYKFGRHDRRKQTRTVTDEEVGSLFSLSADEVEKLRSSPILSLAVEKECDSGGNEKKKLIRISGDGFTCRISPEFPGERTVRTGAKPRRLE